LVPKIALLCNLIVVSGGVLRYHKNKLIPWNLALPLVVVSVPFAWLGGYTSISQFWFSIALGLSLLVAILPSVNIGSVLLLVYPCY